MNYDFPRFSINFIKNLSGIVYLSILFLENRWILPFQEIFTWFFCMSRNTLMFQSGIKRIYRKSVTYPKIMGRFLWSAVGRTEEFTRNRPSDNAPKAFLATITHIQKSSRLCNPMTVEERSEPECFSHFIKESVSLCKAQQFCHAHI